MTLRILFGSVFLCSLAAAQPSPIVAPVAGAPQARIYITDSNSWQVTSGGVSGSGAAGGVFGAGAISSSSGGARPQTAEIIKTFGQKCPQLIANNRPNMADYVVELDHEGGKSILSHKNKIAVFVRTSGDGIFSMSTLSVGGSVENACTAIQAHWAAHAVELKAASATAAAPAPPPIPIVVQTAAAATPGVNVGANVPNCDIEVDGEFVGNTPSVVTLAPGKHQIAVKKSGYQDWSKAVTVTGGNVQLNAEMVAR